VTAAHALKHYSMDKLGGLLRVCGWMGYRPASGGREGGHAVPGLTRARTRTMDHGPFPAKGKAALPAAGAAASDLQGRGGQS